MNNRTYKSSSELDTRNIAKEIAKDLNFGDVIVLSGDLGAGKTAFMNGIAEYFDILQDICSPTFTIVNEYDLKNGKKIHHFDVYRLEDEEEFLAIGGTDYFTDDAICFLEWGKIVQNLLPANTIYIDIERDGINDNNRIIKVNGGI